MRFYNVDNFALKAVVLIVLMFGGLMLLMGITLSVDKYNKNTATETGDAITICAESSYDLPIAALVKQSFDTAQFKSCLKDKGYQIVVIKDETK